MLLPFSFSGKEEQLIADLRKHFSLSPGGLLESPSFKDNG